MTVVRVCFGDEVGIATQFFFLRFTCGLSREESAEQSFLDGLSGCGEAWRGDVEV